MLIPEDELLLHQAALTMSQTTTSDHRFYDRCFLTAVSPAGDVSFAMSLGVYKNMNVMDGFACVATPDRQYNVRVSRPLRPLLDTVVHGLRYEVRRPMHELRLALDGAGSRLAFDLRWRARCAPMVEDRWWGTSAVVSERIATDVQRYAQVGVVDGWIEVDGARTQVAGWFGGRDHSWGVRAGVGGFEPRGDSHRAGSGLLVSWVLFATTEASGYVASAEDADGRRLGVDGVLRLRGADGDLRITEACFRPVFRVGSRYYERAWLEFRTEDGAERHLEIEPVDSAVICKGGGYDNGWADGLGLGVFRGDRVEADVYEPTGEPGLARVQPGGGTVAHNQREQLARIRLDGDHGSADATVIAFGELPRYGITA